MSDLLHVTSSPHVRGKDDTTRIMLYVIISLLPATCFGIWNFGVHALLLILVTVASCVLSEYLYEKLLHKKSTIKDLSAVVTGLLLALNFPSTIPLWMAILGGMFAIIVVKMLFHDTVQHNKPHVHVYYGEYEASVALDGELLEGKLPLSIGGGIGQSRLCMVLLHKGHIGEIQASIWPEDMRKACKALGMNLI